MDIKDFFKDQESRGHLKVVGNPEEEAIYQLEGQERETWETKVKKPEVPERPAPKNNQSTERNLQMQTTSSKISFNSHHSPVSIPILQMRKLEAKEVRPHN